MKSTILAFAVLALVGHAASLKCYTCNSYSNEKECADPFNSTAAKALEFDCSKLRQTRLDPPKPNNITEMECVKAVVPINDTTSFISRSCHRVVDGDDICKQMEALYGDKTECDTCDEDLCNGVSNLYPSILITVYAMFLKFMM